MSGGYSVIPLLLFREAAAEHFLYFHQVFHEVIDGSVGGEVEENTERVAFLVAVAAGEQVCEGSAVIGLGFGFFRRGGGGRGPEIKDGVRAGGGFLVRVFVAAVEGEGFGVNGADVFRDVGGFPESYSRPAIEDIELGYTLMSKGYKTALVKDLQVTHTKKWTFLNLVKTDILMRGIPWTMLLLKTRSFTKDLNLQTHNRVSVVLVYLVLLALLLSSFWPWMLASVLPLLGFLVYLNWDLYQFFAEKHGFLFALKAFPMHLLYYLYNGISFWLGVLGYRLSKNTKDDAP